MSAYGQGLGAAIAAQAQRLVPPFVAFEKVCLDVGVRLGDAAPGLTGLSETFASVSDLLQGPAMAGACRDLEAIAADLARTADLVDEESRALHELVTLTVHVGPQVQSLQGFIRTVAALVFTLKIESAQLPAQSAEMIAFAKTLQELAEQARDSLDAFQSTQTRLDSSLRASAATQTEFQRSHRERLSAIATEILQDLGAVAERRARAAAALQDVGRLSREIGDKVGVCVVGLQIGDSTRQRVEHVAFALDFAAGALGGAAVAVDPVGLAARTLELQRRQVDETRADLDKDARQVSASLTGLIGQAHELESRGRHLFGGDGDGSFLEAIGRQLSAARTLVEQGLQARASVDQAKRAVAAAMAELETRTKGLTDVASDVSMIGTNASLRSTRLGDAGKGVTLIAAELRGFGREIRSTIGELAAALDRVIAFVDRFSQAQSELEATRLAQLGQRMQAAVAIFGDCGRRMSEALDALAGESGKTRETLETAAQTLARHDGVGAELEAAAREIDMFRNGLGAVEGDATQIDGVIAKALRPIYSMASERRAHDRFEGVVSAPEDDEAPTEAADAFML